MKKDLLQKMFPKEGLPEPEVRFPEFRGLALTSISESVETGLREKVTGSGLRIDDLFRMDTDNKNRSGLETWSAG